MYYEHFGLNQPPFTITPNLDFFYSGGKREAVLDALVYAITHGEGIIKVVGEVGAGKTMLSRMLETRLPKNIEIIYLVNPSLTRDEILYAIADELGLEVENGRSAQISRALQGFLIEKYAQGQQVVVFIDEAQAMPLDSLEEVRLLSNLETGTHKLLQIVLFGQPELDAHLELPHMRQLKERITHGFTLQPFGQKEITEYLKYRLHIAGYRGPDVFGRVAIRQIAHFSKGLVRRINILADKALLAAYAENKHLVAPRHVETAARDSDFGKSRSLLQSLATISITVSLTVVVWLSWENWPMPTPPKKVVAPPALAVPAATPVESKEIPVSAPVASAVPEEAAPPEKLPEPPTLPAAPISLLQQRQAAMQQRLDAGDSDTFYTIQLIATSPRRAEAELDRLRDKLDTEQLFIYDTRAGGEKSIGIVFGAYAGATEARAVMAKLPPAFQQNRPQLRTFGGIRTEIHKTAPPS